MVLSPKQPAASVISFSVASAANLSPLKSKVGMEVHANGTFGLRRAGKSATKFSLLFSYSGMASFTLICTYQTPTETHHLIYSKVSKYNKVKLPHTRRTQLEHKIPDTSKLNFPLWEWLQSAGCERSLQLLWWNCCLLELHNSASPMWKANSFVITGCSCSIRMQRVHCFELQKAVSLSEGRRRIVFTPAASNHWELPHLEEPTLG